VGGDEFVILLSETGYEGAETVLKRIQDAVRSEMKAHGWPVTLSIGAVTYTVLPSTVGPMLKKADEIMYTVKRAGKDNFAHIQWPPESLETIMQEQEGSEHTGYSPL
jgi:diguanylate cyclase (GGDEF)-like protein